MGLDDYVAFVQVQIVENAVLSGTAGSLIPSVPTAASQTTISNANNLNPPGAKVFARLSPPQAAAAFVDQREIFQHATSLIPERWWISDIG
ncbi:unnamed protein product [Angiostrongylus costaricensis]|uniref:Coat protein n=1 Tax=Angiostrongylus costaricensis TaxID=334426 RepID=A0A0R3PTJ4_ANGCS|nr:unnamed protein product [Angiostrongylus costaricensis]